MSDFLNFKNQITSALQDKVAGKLADLRLRMTDDMFNDGTSLNRDITVEEGFNRVMRVAEMLSEAAPNEAVIRALKPAFASEFAFYSKAHSFHWNVEGSDFKEFHDLFGGIYEEVYGSIDDFAENIRKAGGYAPNSLETISELAHIDSTGMIGDPLSMASDLLEDSETLSDMFGVVYKIAESAGAYGLANFLADRQDAHDKHSWMLRSTLKAAGYEVEEVTEESKLNGAAPTNKEKASSKIQVPVSKEAQQKSPSVTKPEAAGPGPKFGDADFCPEGDKMKPAPKFSSDTKDEGAKNLVSASTKVLARISQAEQQKKPSISTPETKGPGPKFGDADVVAGPTNKPAPSFSSDKEDEGAANRVAASTKVQKKISKEEQQTKPSISTPENNPGLPSFSDVNFREDVDSSINFAKTVKRVAAKYSLKETAEQVDEDGIPGHDRKEAPAESPVIMDSKKIKKEAVEDLKGKDGSNTPGWEDVIKQSLLTLDKDGNAVVKQKASDARADYTANPDDETLAKVGLKKK